MICDCENLCMFTEIYRNSIILYVVGVEFDSEDISVSKPMLLDVSKNPNLNNLPCTFNADYH